MILKTSQSSPRSSFGLFGGALWRPQGPGVSLESAAGRLWRRHGSPWGPLGSSLGVLKGPSGHLWECSRVPRGHLGSACGALPALKIIEKPLVFIVFPAMGDPCATLERLWFVLWGRLVPFGGHWVLLTSPRVLLGGPLGVLVPWRVPRGPQGPLGSSRFPSSAPDLAIIAFSHDLSSLHFKYISFLNGASTRPDPQGVGGYLL